MCEGARRELRGAHGAHETARHCLGRKMGPPVDGATDLAATLVMCWCQARLRPSRAQLKLWSRRGRLLGRALSNWHVCMYGRTGERLAEPRSREQEYCLARSAGASQRVMDAVCHFESSPDVFESGREDFLLCQSRQRLCLTLSSCCSSVQHTVNAILPDRRKGMLKRLRRVRLTTEPPDRRGAWSIMIVSLFFRELTRTIPLRQGSEGPARARAHNVTMASHIHVIRGKVMHGGSAYGHTAPYLEAPIKVARRDPR